MRIFLSRFLLVGVFTWCLSLASLGQETVREIALPAGSVLQVTNKFGRVAVKAEPVAEGKPFVARLSATSPGGVSDADIKISGTVVTVTPADAAKRVDLNISVPERSSLKIETAAGVIEVGGGLAFVQARSETGTISADVPLDDLTYQFQWTESRPRVVADIELAKTKERSAGRFEIKGKHRADTPGEATDAVEPIAVLLNFSTARGIILLNVPPNEVASDLRERPLTDAAKAIIRSGDSLLMEAIRRASPRYFGDYARTLPPLKLEPSFAQRNSRLDVPAGNMLTALVRVTDLQNRSIAGLRAADFEVIENGVERPIVSVEPSTAPMNVVLLLDVSGSVENYVNFIRRTARSFVETIDPGDRLSIVIFNDDVKVLSRFTTDRGKLFESLDTFDAGGGTAYYDALAYTISDTLRPLKGERTAIVILTDGDDNRSFLAFDSLAGSIQESGALIYPLYVPSGLIALGAMGGDIDPLRKRYMALTAKSEGEGEKLAKLSGGVYYPISQIGQIQQAYEDIVRQIRTAYNVTYRSELAANGSSGASPRIRIRVKRENSFTSITTIKAASR